MKLRVILASNWPSLRIRALWRLARSRHEIAGIIIYQKSSRAPLINLLMKTTSHLPKAHFIAKRILSARQAEHVALRRAAHLNNVRVFECTDINGTEALRFIRELNPDVVLTMTWPKKFGAELLNLPRLGCINCHPSLLPKHRGRFPLTAALLAGETETGVTFHLMNEEYDAGDILLQKPITIAPQDNGVTLFKKCGRLALDSQIEVLDGIAEGRLLPRPQETQKDSLMPGLNQTDGLIDWNMASTQIACKVRALYPWIMPHTFHHDQRIDFTVCETAAGATGAAPGRILACTDKSILVATQDAAIMVKSPRFAGFSRRRSKDYLKTHIKSGGFLGANS